MITNRHANLVLLILENLVANAIQVTPRDRMVRVNFSRVGGHLVCRVQTKAGFPAYLREIIFSPCRSTKGGSGLGLAISRQLANQLGAKLELTRSSQAGCVFELDLPLSVLTGKSAELPG
jgi:signal transduction histidine kinase